MILRQARESDADAIAAIYAPYVRDTDISFETEPPNAATMAARIAASITGELPWIVADDGEVAGYAYASRFHGRNAYRFTVEPTVYIAQHARHGGIGTMLYKRLLTVLTELHYREAIALVAVPNAASEALHARCGFHRSGTYERAGYKFDRWIDVALFQRTLDTASAPPEAPCPLNQSLSWEALG